MLGIRNRDPLESTAGMKILLTINTQLLSMRTASDEEDIIRDGMLQISRVEGQIMFKGNIYSLTDKDSATLFSDWRCGGRMLYHEIFH